MDLIYTNASRVDVGVLRAYSFDLSFGASENDFEITLGAGEPTLEYGAFVYIDGTEYGGIVDAMKASTASETITYMGRTWHGIINSKVIEPDAGSDYLIVSGDANNVLSTLISRLGLESLFAAEESTSGVNIKNYKFNRYCAAYDGIRAMLAASKAKLKIKWEDRAVKLYAEPVADYTDTPVDGDIAELEIEQHAKKVNHLICLGQGDLAAREVIHLYVNAFGQIVDAPYYMGIDEITEAYDYGSVESSSELRSGGIERLNELRDVDSAEISVNETDAFNFDIGDIVGASDSAKTRMSVSAAVTQKIVRINNGAISTEYKAGG